MPAFSLQIEDLLAAYRDGSATPEQVVDDVYDRIEAWGDEAVWISLVPREEAVAKARALPARPEGIDGLALYGVPFAVKDNIDCAGLPTTAACPDYAYQPWENATAVQRLLDAGAILIGKTNLDQFATGLNGTRSPYGAPRCVFDRDYISGGSSSGSAVAVAAGMVSFALGTDTAGSGRVPAALNNIVGVKPTKGLLSTAGVVPACRSLDCVTVFSFSVGDANRVRHIAQANDGDDPYGRTMAPRPLPLRGFRFGILAEEDRVFFDDRDSAGLYDRACERLASLGGQAVAFDYQPFGAAAALLYEGPWVSERLAAIQTFFNTNPMAVHPVVRQIVRGARQFTGVDVFEGQYRLKALERVAAREWEKFDFMLLPTCPTTYRVSEMEADPIQLNANLGVYTNFVNLLDCCGIAVPAGKRRDGLPLGVTLIGPAFADDSLAVLADRLHRALVETAGATGELLSTRSLVPEPAPEAYVDLAVVGAHLRGMPLHHQLTELEARFVRACRTAPDYRLFALPNTEPAKPGLIREPGYEGKGIEVEVWRLTEPAFGRFVGRVPSPLGIGTVELEDGLGVKGFLCEDWAVRGAEDITAYGGWKAYCTALTMGKAAGAPSA
ncbi:MAG: allophanate hydrolase [Alphaproteobacteria bacterium]|nr:allophanate hydrolase [Alphaproteobacteria bacterium]